MKKYIFLLLIFTSFITYSQFGGMRNQRQRQMPQTPQQAPEPDFKVEKYIGIIIYDIEKAAKKTGVKLSSDKGKKFSGLLTKYNKEVKDIRRINSFTLRSTKEMVENYQKKVAKTGDLTDQVKVQKKLADNLKPISETLKVEDEDLSKKLKEILTTKQYKKWLKYNRKQGKFLPKEEK